ncbi:hypothetical protein TraAM80_06904 [Trypanosoma rangeli]|uniref:Uncharacterized protein n=1 Tax=Trypanosoma rangeli TaxID=5698 RepID=A0A3R7K4W1_TRYRA|nr:uncharacterized protein TraAM80_06904 [Trypanosoma rangeli]RNF01720.1 hypothetical protein TraAM80_06904 [Trypanosoma rangeli]|eukprot:RNF01720.1 hypothetical protein TraAM80_06904 [Trypanosoma rangeli]
MPLFNIVAKKLKASEYVVQKVEEGKALRTVLPHISRKLGIPSMKNYVAFMCDEKRQPVGLLDMDVPLEEQGVRPLSFIYVSPIDATPKRPDGRELPLASELKQIRQQEEEEEDVPPSPPPPLEEKEETLVKLHAEEEEAAKRPVVRIHDVAAGESVNQSLYKAPNNGHCRVDSTHSTGVEHRVQINPVPDVAGVVEPEDSSIDVECPAPDVMALQLAALAKEGSVHYTVLLRLANLVLSKRPSNPQVFLWSHLQGKSGGPETGLQLQKKENYRRALSATPTFAPVGDTAEERLVSVSPAGPARTAMRSWAKRLLESKPDNPVVFMWSKLEAKMERDALGMSVSRISNSGVTEDSTKLLLLRGVPRNSPSYVVMRNLVDRILDKKPEQPEIWMLYNFVARFRTSASASGNSPPASFQRADEVPTEDDNCSSNREDAFPAMGASMPRAFSMLPNQWVDSVMPHSIQNIVTQPQTREISTQTSSTFQPNEVADAARVAIVPRAKSVSPAPAGGFLCDRSPRELLQPPPCDPQLFSCRHCGCDAGGSDREHRQVSPFCHGEYGLLCDPLQRAVGTLPQQGYSTRNLVLPSQPREGNPSGCGGNNGKRADGDRARQGEALPIPPWEKIPLQPESPSFLFLSGESSELQYEVRRREMERAETLYEYNWLLQREAIRKEQLQKELELLRYERGIRERMMRHSPNAHVAVTARTPATSQDGTERCLYGFRRRGSPEPPSELDVIRKRLELLDMEEARFRHLSRTPNRLAVPTRRDAVSDAVLRATHDSPALLHYSDRVGISPHFNPVVQTIAGDGDLS